MTRVEMTVNGQPVSGEVEGRTLLVEFLRDHEHRVHYVREPFQREPDFGTVSVNYAFDHLLASAEEPA